MFGKKGTTTRDYKSNTQRAAEMLEYAMRLDPNSQQRTNALLEALVLLNLNTNASTRAGMWGSLSAGMK